ncbi:SGNH/GDSL hydrolase family protein [Nocardia iowensis]|uniref:SGNH/GDSL hydrolase family protein n=1 Tax=Nocardia iowensis TaxID=204891 RepID=UPI00248491FF|nr:GDSL-type esterase/lipase family protein [Nocardia iowensis]
MTERLAKGRGCVETWWGTEENTVPRSGTRTLDTTVVCAGDSITSGQYSADYIAMLRARNEGRLMTFIRAGVNGDHSYSLLARLDAIIEQQPDIATVLIGSNDAWCSLSEDNALASMRRRKLPTMPTIGDYRENLSAITQRLLEETNARIALLSLPVLGQELDSLPARTTRLFSRVVKETAAAYGVAYLPLYERQIEHLRSVRSRQCIPYRDDSAFRARVFARHRLLMGRSLDDIARLHGLELTTDFVHQNSRGAAMIADLIGDFIDAR